jgi:hypothetical protein
MMGRGLLVVLAFATACAGASPPDATHDHGAGDFATATFDLAQGADLACVLGTADHCGSCATACPGMDTSATLRTCSAATSAGTCDIECKGDYYDVDGVASNGCEALDVTQSSATTATAVTLANVAPAGGSCNNTNNGCTVSMAIASDMRKHDSAPPDRPLGLEDWWKVTAVGAGGSNPMKACLSISNADWPTDNKYEVCISPLGSMTPSTCATAIARMPSMCVQPTGNTDAGTYYLRVRKTVGMPTGLGYALYLEH